MNDGVGRGGCATVLPLVICLIQATSVQARPDQAMTAIDSRYYSSEFSLSPLEQYWFQEQASPREQDKLSLYAYTGNYVSALPMPSNSEQEYAVISGVGLQWSNWLSFQSQLVHVGPPSLSFNLELASVWHPRPSLSLQAIYASPSPSKPQLTLGASYRF